MAVIENGVITNVIVAGDSFPESENLKDCPYWLWIGDTYNPEKPQEIIEKEEQEEKERLENQLVQEAYDGISKADILELIASLAERVEKIEGSN